MVHHLERTASPQSSSQPMVDPTFAPIRVVDGISGMSFWVPPMLILQWQQLGMLCSGGVNCSCRQPWRVKEGSLVVNYFNLATK